jgi:hypothetical protein
MWKTAIDFVITGAYNCTVGWFAEVLSVEPLLRQLILNALRAAAVA